MESHGERFIEIATGTISNRGRCINLKDIGKEILHCQTTKQELYRSHFFFDNTLVDHLRVYKSVRGFLGKPIIDSLILDIDKGSNSDEWVHNQAKAMYYKLQEMGVDDINIRPYYSGSGFHIEVPNLWNFETHDEVKATIADNFPELDTIYDRTRLIRVSNTINYKTQRYKIPLELGELLNSSIAEIIEAAQYPRNTFSYPPFEEGTSLEKLKRKPVVLSDMNPMNNDGFSPIVTCMQKLYVSEPKHGQRHINMLRMISAYKRSGIPQLGIEVMMKEWARGQMEIGEIRKIVGDVFKKNYSYSCSDEIMHQWCDERCMFFKRKNYNDAIPEDNRSMEDRMKMFALQGESNVLVDLQKFLHISTPFKIYRKEFVTILGDTGLGKSAFVQNIAVDYKKIRTLYLNFEVGETLFYRRFLQIAHIKSKEAIIEYYLQPSPGSLAGPIEHIKMISKRITLHALEQLLTTGEYDLIVADTLECFQTPGITEITPKTEHIAHELKRMVEKYNVSVIAIHHVSKGGIQDPQGGKKKLTAHSGKGSGAVEQQSDKVIAFEGNADKPTRKVSSLKARDESPFTTHLHFDAENSFRFYKIQKEETLISSASTDRKTDSASNSSIAYLSSQ